MCVYTGVLYMCVYTWIYVYIHICMCAHVCVYVHTCMCAYVYVYVCMCTCVCSCIYTLMCICAYTCVRAYMCMCIYMCLCICLCIHVCVCMHVCVCVCLCVHVCGTRHFPGVSAVRNLPAKRETRVQSLSRDDPLEKGMATDSNILPWKILWTEEPGGLQSAGSPRVRHKWATNLHTQRNIYVYMDGAPLWLSKESACNCGRPRFSPWVRKIPWGAWQAIRSMALQRLGLHWATNTHRHRHTDTHTHTHTHTLRIYHLRSSVRC